MKITSFFNEVWQTTKDAAAYTTGTGNAYVVCRDLIIDKENGYPCKYWLQVPSYAGATSSNWINTPLPSGVLQDVGYTSIGGEIYLDFVYNGRKVVIRYDPSYHKLLEKQAAFKLSQEKADACRQLRQQGEQLAAMLEVWCNTTLKLKRSKNTTPATRKLIADNDIQLNKCLDECSKLRGLNIVVDKTRSDLQLNGVGEITTATAVVMSCVAVAVVAMSVAFIISQKEDTARIQNNNELQVKALQAKERAMNSPTLTPAQKNEIIKSADSVITDAQANNKYITQDKPGVIAEAKQLLMWGLAAVAVIKLAPLILNKKEKN